MAHHHEEKEKSVAPLYYLVGAVCGIFTGAVIEKGITWVVVGAVLGLLAAALFQQVFVRGREQR